MTSEQSQLRYDCEWTRFINSSELSMEPHVNDVTEEMLAQYLDFLRNELEYAIFTILYCILLLFSNNIKK